MKTVLRIFASDIRSVSRRLFASAIIVAISFLPALYAWVNIYANGNPYANTGNISIALASRDPGITLEDGTHINMADEVFEEMKASDKIDWQFPDSAEEAIEGVRSGKYYAAVVFEDNFTYNMYHFEQALLDDRAPLTFYENTKKNAVAAKITETAAGNLQESIKTKYLETVFGLIFDESNDIADRLEDGDTVEAVIGQLESIRDTLRSYDDSISSFTKNTESLISGLSGSKGRLQKTRASARKSINAANADLAQARSSLEVLRKMLEVRQKRIEKERAELEKILEQLSKAGLTDEEKAALQKEAEEVLDVLLADIQSLRALFPDSEGINVAYALTVTLDDMIINGEGIKQALKDEADSTALMTALKDLSQVSLLESVNQVIDTIDSLMLQMKPLAESMSVMLDDIGPVIDAASEAVASLDSSLAQMQKVMRATADDIDSLIDKINAASEGDKLELLITLLGGDPEKYAAFFSALVDVDILEVYYVASYGAAMAPFYSVLAIWVGGVILVSILKTHIDRKKFPEATEAEAFFGRFILFWLIGQVQAAVIIAGDILLLGCGPVHPGLMFLAASVTSFVFVMLIYALTLSFGDIGKAMVVVVMVVQIAGSSGSYPIEILPPVFGKIYKFFPFPYAINAIREALSGTYRHDYIIFLGELLLFAVLALAIGLLVRKPFIGLNDFVSEKIEETEVL